MNLAYVRLSNGLRASAQAAHIIQGLLVAHRLEMILKRLAADRQALLQHDRGFTARKRIALDGVGRIGQFYVIPCIQRRLTAAALQTQII